MAENHNGIKLVNSNLILRPLGEAYNICFDLENELKLKIGL
jgi:hypothetical protein